MLFWNCEFSPNSMKLITSSGLLTTRSLASFLPLSESSAASKTKARDPSPKPEPTLEAEFSINPPELSPASTIKVVFPTPMIAKERVGSTEVDSLLVVVPALKGSFQWVSTRSGQFKLARLRSSMRTMISNYAQI